MITTRTNSKPRIRFSAFPVAVAVLLVTAIGFFTFAGSQEVTVTQADVASISMPNTVAAGSLVSIDVASLSESGVADLEVAVGYGQLVFAVPVSANHGRLELPAALTQQAGVITVSSGDVSETLTVMPADVSELIAPLVGPRTIVADGQDVTMAVVVPTDRYGNMVVDQTRVVVDWQQPSRTGENTESRIVSETADGLAWTLLPSGEVTGASRVTAIAETSQGEPINAAAVRVDEVPGLVAGIELAVESASGVADGRSLAVVETGELFDGFANPLADGTVASFVYAGPSGHGVVPGTVQNGVVRIEIVAPSSPGALTGHLELQGRESNEISIEFTAAVSSFEAHLERVGDDVVLRIEDVLDQDGAFVADGTDVQWGQVQTRTRRGTAEIQLPAGLIPDHNEPVRILGLEQIPVGGSL